MPRGVYQRRGGAATATAVAPAKEKQTPEIDENLAAEAKQAYERVNTIAHTIRTSHDRISTTALEIGHHFFEIKTSLEGINSTMRRQLKIPSWTVWMNRTAPQVCNMTSRTAWNYFRAYAETLASGLSDKTITALAPTVLKTEKARSAVVRALVTRPELVQKLNEVAKAPRDIRKLAESPEFQAIVKRAEPRPTVTAAEKVTRAIVNAYSDVFMRDGDFDERAANEGLQELVAAINGASQELGIGGNLTLTTTPIHRVIAEPTESRPSASALTDAIEHLSALVKAGAATNLAPARA